MSLVHISQRRKAVEIPGCPPYSQSSVATAWPNRAGCKFEGKRRQRSDFIERRLKRTAENERPVRGDNRTGQAIWALGVDGRSRQIQPRWGGITAPTAIGRDRAAGRSNGVAIFLTFWRAVPRPKNTVRRGLSDSLRRSHRAPP